MAKKPDPAEKPATTTITVVASQDLPRWRAGIKFGREPVTVDVTDEQLAEIQDDDVLTISANPAPAAAAKS